LVLPTAFDQGRNLLEESSGELVAPLARAEFHPV
jgi:hypothetical protein